MKDILELLLKLGWEVPRWLLIVLFIFVILGITFVFVKKQIVPVVHKAVKVKHDLDSINTLKDEQSKIKDEQIKIMQNSIEGDQQLSEEIECLKGDVDSLHTKLDEIAGTLQKLCDKEEAEGMSRAQNRLLEMYKRYGLNNESKSWSRYESEVFFNTLDSYVAHGGNSFILETVVPVMKLLTVIDE